MIDWPEEMWKHWKSYKTQRKERLIIRIGWRSSSWLSATHRSKWKVSNFFSTFISSTIQRFSRFEFAVTGSASLHCIHSSEDSTQYWWFHLFAFHSKVAAASLEHHHSWWYLIYPKRNRWFTSQKNEPFPKTWPEMSSISSEDELRACKVPPRS